MFSKRLLANTRGENGEETTKDPRNPFTPCAFELWAPLSDRVSRSDLHRVPFPFLSTSDVARTVVAASPERFSDLRARLLDTMIALVGNGLLLARSCRLARTVPLRIASRALA